MSQTQPELNAAIDDLFGDSSDEEDLKDEEVSVPKKPLVTTTRDDDDLFESDESEDEVAPAPKRSRLMKGGDKSVAKKKPRIEKSTSSQKSSEQSAQEQEESGQSGDEYDSDADIVRTKEDDNFLDNDEDDADLLKEYEAENQEFHDDRPEYSRPQGRGGAGGMLPSASSNVASDPLSQAMAEMKKKKPPPMTETQKGDIATEVLRRLDKAYNDDKLLYEQQLPAINKLKLLPQMKRMLGNRQMQNTLLDYDLLSVLNAWIEPISKSALPNLDVRTTVYDLLMILPCHTEHVKRSNIGKTLVLLAKCKMETAPNRQKIRSIIEKWSRPIFGKSTDEHAMDIRDKQVFETQDEKRRRLENAIRHSPRASESEKAGIDSVLAGTASKTVGDNGFSRVRCPTSNGFMFTARPVSNVQRLSRSSKKDDEQGVRGKITKRMTSMKGSDKKGNFRLVNPAVSGRDKA